MSLTGSFNIFQKLLAQKIEYLYLAGNLVEIYYVLTDGKFGSKYISNTLGTLTISFLLYITYI